MRITLPKNLTKKQLFEYLRDNERDLIETKCAFPIAGEPCSIGIVTPDAGIATKAVSAETKAALLPDSIVVDAVANLACWYDMHGDVMLPDSWKKSIAERGKRMVWLKNHSWDITSKIAKVLDVYAADMDLKALGIKSDIKTAQALIFQGEFNPKYDDTMYNKYAAGMVDQHSIGLQYIQMELGINDPEDKPHYKVWEKYLPMVINKSDAMARGYLWAIKEAKIIENSAVLFGANEITPTISITAAGSLQNNEAGKSATFENQPNKARLKSLQLLAEKF